ncbi:UNVERIFIED_CONTAM: putative disease resistance RPP8-like protein 4 [Sesamum angustifolium]|uniref:Disease resistance RPP8-like protein 4 n=1 Tax=Sesamum angustifolium TaxID=2727405 RepID=A0AAW2IVC9_9LAMI
MGGIGKTTLAANVYSDPLIEYYFDTRAWITLSQVYNVPDILVQVLNSLRKLSDTMVHQSEDELSEHIHKTCVWRRYLIVMDDVWSTKSWDDFRRYFPDNKNGSRIILTTRLERVAIYAGSFKSSPLHESFV